MNLIKQKIKFLFKKIESLYFKYNKKEVILIKEKQNKNFVNGFLYIVFGDSFTKEAILSIKSLKRYNNEPIAIFTDHEEFLEEIKNDIDFIYKIEPHHKRTKVDFIKKTPFQKTIYLDSDTIIASNISDILNYYCLYYRFCEKKKKYV